MRDQIDRVVMDAARKIAPAASDETVRALRVRFSDLSEILASLLAPAQAGGEAGEFSDEWSDAERDELGRADAADACTCYRGCDEVDGWHQHSDDLCQIASHAGRMVIPVQAREEPPGVLAVVERIAYSDGKRAHVGAGNVEIPADAPDRVFVAVLDPASAEGQRLAAAITE